MITAKIVYADVRCTSPYKLVKNTETLRLILLYGNITNINLRVTILA